MTGESPKSSRKRPPSWPNQPPSGEISKVPIAADPAPPWWWRCWIYDPAPPWIELLEEPELKAVFRAKLTYERARLEATLAYMDNLQAVLDKRKG